MPIPPARAFDIDCKLAYTLPTTTDFVFLIHALDGEDQAVESESLRMTPGASHRVHADPLGGHRFLRVQAPAGAFTLRYKARVQVRRQRPDPDAAEAPIDALPDDVLQNLMATRYCESDLLASATLKLFGESAPGYARVEEI